MKLYPYSIKHEKKFSSSNERFGQVSRNNNQAMPCNMKLPYICTVCRTEYQSYSWMNH